MSEPVSKFVFESRAASSPEQKLMLAMMKQARRDLSSKHGAIVGRARVVEDLLDGRGRRHKATTLRLWGLVVAWREARDFFLPSSKTSTLPIACEILGWNTDAVREAVKEWMNLPWNGRALQRALDEAPKYARA